MVTALALLPCPSLSVMAALALLSGYLAPSASSCWLPFPLSGGCLDCLGCRVSAHDQWLPLPLPLLVGCPSLSVVAALTALAAVSLLGGCPFLSLSAALPSPYVGCPSLSVVALSLLMISGCLCLSLLAALPFQGLLP